MNEPTGKIFLGVIDKTGDPDEVFVVPDLNASPEEIAAAISAVNAARAEAKRKESADLRSLFLGEEKNDG